MEKKVYVWIKQEYEDINEVKVFESKQKALDYTYETIKNIINNLSDDYLSCGFNISVEEMRNKMLNTALENYQKGNIDYFDIREVNLE